MTPQLLPYCLIWGTDILSHSPQVLYLGKRTIIILILSLHFVTHSQIFAQLECMASVLSTQCPLLCSLLRRRDASKNPEQCSFSESQYSGSKQHGISGWPLILSLPGRRTSARWERRQLKDWSCLAPSLTGEAVCPSETVCCSTSSSSILWWITHVRSGGPLPAATSGSCKCYNPSVFALRLTHLRTLVTGKFTRIWGFHSSPTTSEHWLTVSNQS
jgi:hypothetical protein